MNERITIITGGQTGVDRGALRGALEVGFSVGGYMPKNLRDEDGPIPDEIRIHLQPCPIPGLGARTTANVEMADALLVIVPDCDDPIATPGTRRTWFGARDRQLPRQALDPSSELTSYANQLYYWAKHHPGTKVMVAGPRASKWPQGEYEAAGILRRLGMLLAIKRDQLAADQLAAASIVQSPNPALIGALLRVR